jgi:hypothetical protein
LRTAQIFFPARAEVAIGPVHSLRSAGCVAAEAVAAIPVAAKGHLRSVAGEGTIKIALGAAVVVTPPLPRRFVTSRSVHEGGAMTMMFNLRTMPRRTATAVGEMMPEPRSLMLSAPVMIPPGPATITMRAEMALMRSTVMKAAVRVAVMMEAVMGKMTALFAAPALFVAPGVRLPSMPAAAISEATAAVAIAVMMVMVMEPVVLTGSKMTLSKSGAAMGEAAVAPAGTMLEAGTRPMIPVRAIAMLALGMMSSFGTAAGARFGIRRSVLRAALAAIRFRTSLRTALSAVFRPATHRTWSWRASWTTEFLRPLPHPGGGGLEFLAADGAVPVGIQALEQAVKIRPAFRARFPRRTAARRILGSAIRALRVGRAGQADATQRQQ